MMEEELREADMQDQPDVLAAARQVATMVEKILGLAVRRTSSPPSFHAERPHGKKGAGILSARVDPGGEGLLVLRVELIRGPENLRVALTQLFASLSRVDGKVRLLAPEKKPDGEVSFWAELPVAARVLPFHRETLLAGQLDKLNRLAADLQEALPGRSPGWAALVRIYREFDEALSPVAPWPEDQASLDAAFLDWSRESCGFLSGGFCLALVSADRLSADCALAVMAGLMAESGGSLGQLRLPAITGRAMVELAAKAPGIIAAPAAQLSFGTSPYDMGNEMTAMLHSLSSSGRPAVFFGSFGELTKVFSGGQGGSCDPLLPLVRHLPDLAFPLLVRFAVEKACEKKGGFPAHTVSGLTSLVEEALAGLPSASRKRVLAMTSARAVDLEARGHACRAEGLSAYARELCGLSETLGGLDASPSVDRDHHVARKYTEVLTHPGLAERLGEEVLGQDRALAELSEHLAAEALVRPAHQPIRMCLQGPSASGKSESAAKLARLLGIPHVNIDAASMPDPHTAISQILGSGRGIVQSHQAGRLEQAAKQHTGALVEISDVDHALPSVRTVMNDLLLQVLETGLAQSATGAMFSCSGVIFALTMNLPDDQDEKVRRRLGFSGAALSRADIRENVLTQMKSFASMAFLSRIGTPILFDPISPEAWGLILERCIDRALRSAVRRKGVRLESFSLEEGLGARLMDLSRAEVNRYGARRLLEEGRKKAAAAFLHWAASCPAGEGLRVRVGIDRQGVLVLKQEK